MSTNHGTRTLVLYSYSTHGMQLRAAALLAYYSQRWRPLEISL